MADKGDVDFDGLELIDMRLEIDVDTLVTYMEENSEFPGMTSYARALPAPTAPPFPR